MRIFDQLHGDKVPIDVRTIKDSDLARDWDSGEHNDEIEEIVAGLHMLESILSTRLSAETFHGITDFFNAFRPDTTNYGIKKRLVCLTR